MLRVPRSTLMRLSAAVECYRGSVRKPAKRKKPRSWWKRPMAKGHRSAALPMLRPSRTMNGNPADDAGPMKQWRREYEPGWEPKA